MNISARTAKQIRRSNPPGAYGTWLDAKRRQQAHQSAGGNNFIAGKWCGGQETLHRLKVMSSLDLEFRIAERGGSVEIEDIF